MFYPNYLVGIISKENNVITAHGNYEYYEC